MCRPAGPQSAGPLAAAGDSWRRAPGGQCSPPGSRPAGVGLLQRIRIGLEQKAELCGSQFVVQTLLLRRVPGDLRPVVCADHVRLFFSDTSEQVLPGRLQVLHGPLPGYGAPEIARRVIFHAGIVDLEPPLAVCALEPACLPEDGIHSHVPALHVLGPVQCLQVRPPGILPAEAVAVQHGDVLQPLFFHDGVQGFVELFVTDPAC